MASHDEQQSRVSASEALARRWWGLPAAAPVAAAAPAEGWLAPDAGAWAVDPLGTQRRHRDALEAAAPAVLAACAAEARASLAALDQQGPEQLPLAASSASSSSITVELVNLVTMSTVAVDAPRPDAARGAPEAVVIPLRALQRRWMAMGYRKNKVGTAIHVSFVKPWQGTHIVFPPGRVQRTGAVNRTVDQRAFRSIIVPMLRAAGLAHVRVTESTPLNVVAKALFPTRGASIDLACLEARYPAAVTLKHHFTNAVYRPASAMLHPDARGGADAWGDRDHAADDPFFVPRVRTERGGVKLLVYTQGRVVCVGCKSVPQMLDTYREAVEPIMGCLGPPVDHDTKSNSRNQGNDDADDDDDDAMDVEPVSSDDNDADNEQQGARRSRRQRQARVLGQIVY